MLAVVLAFPGRFIHPLTPVNDVPMVKIVEERLLRAKRIDDALTVVPVGQVKKYSLHVRSPVGVRSKNDVEVLLRVLPPAGGIFLANGRMPLIMPFLVDYLSTLYPENGPDALIPRWADGSLEVTHAFYDVDALSDTLETCMAEGEKRLSCIGDYMDYEPVDIEPLSARNPKVALSFLRVRNSLDLRFAEENLRRGL
ncbi:molybdenum cofactor guanylyltransferase [Thermococcus sp. Bubb.Bath]|uniref:molybdenum cofactor guanylyltransferase n=1 Tax=Thermococcus sp. Bubb.Bath TaxID=1638242 RepID=UPI00143CA9C1|nr:molybdenum cofactor guanylyltransferase [Thermococcus sp. Bubb.Bath]NJF24924.1 molybdenum cofactor guanylyltransferase [Thermococcus sp. Bubb.Bath]